MHDDLCGITDRKTIDKNQKINLAAIFVGTIKDHWTRRAYALTQGRPARPPIAYPLNPQWVQYPWTGK
jgi:hypothetical protein